MESSQGKQQGAKRVLSLEVAPGDTGPSEATKAKGSQARLRADHQARAGRREAAAGATEEALKTWSWADLGSASGTLPTSEPHGQTHEGDARGLASWMVLVMGNEAYR